MDIKTKGKRGENIACDWVAEQGMQILARNFRRQEGEVDIVARDKDTIVFIEVKARSGDRYGSPAEAVTPKKAQKIMETAQRFMSEKGWHDTNMRFDVAEVYFTGAGYRVNYIKSAFEG